MSMKQSRRRIRERTRTRKGRYDKTLKKRKNRVKPLKNEKRSRNKRKNRKIDRYKHTQTYQKGGDERVHADPILNIKSVMGQRPYTGNLVSRYQQFVKYMTNPDNDIYYYPIPKNYPTSQELQQLAGLQGDELTSKINVLSREYGITTEQIDAMLHSANQPRQESQQPKNESSEKDESTLKGILAGVLDVNKIADLKNPQEIKGLDDIQKKKATEIIHEFYFMKWLHEFLTKQEEPLELEYVLGSGGMSVVFVVQESQNRENKYVLKITRESVYDGSHPDPHRFAPLQLPQSQSTQSVKTIDPRAIGNYYSGDDVDNVYERLKDQIIETGHDKGSLIYEYIVTKDASKTTSPTSLPYIQSTRDTWGAFAILDVQIASEGSRDRVNPMYSAMIVEPLARPGSLEQFVGSTGPGNRPPNMSTNSRVIGTNVILRDMAQAIKHIEDRGYHNPDIKLENIAFNETALEAQTPEPRPMIITKDERGTKFVSI